MSAERDALKQRLLTLMQQPNFMPMRKRGLAKKLRVDDEDYAAFRRLVEDMAEIYRAQGYATRLHILCRRVADLRAAARAGAWGVLLDPPDLDRF